MAGASTSRQGGKGDTEKQKEMGGTRISALGGRVQGKGFAESYMAPEKGKSHRGSPGAKSTLLFLAFFD